MPEKQGAVIGMEDSGYMPTDFTTRLIDVVNSTTLSDSIIANAPKRILHWRVRGSTRRLRASQFAPHVKVISAEVIQQFFAVSSARSLKRFGKNLLNFEYSESDLKTTRALQYCTGVLFVLTWLSACAGAQRDRRDRKLAIVVPATPSTSDDATYATLAMAAAAKATGVAIMPTTAIAPL